MQPLRREDPFRLSRPRICRLAVRHFVSDSRVLAHLQEEGPKVKESPALSPEICSTGGAICFVHTFLTPLPFGPPTPGNDVGAGPGGTASSRISGLMVSVGTGNCLTLSDRKARKTVVYIRQGWMFWAVAARKKSPLPSTETQHGYFHITTHTAGRAVAGERQGARRVQSVTRPAAGIIRRGVLPRSTAEHREPAPNRDKSCPGP